MMQMPQKTESCHSCIHAIFDSNKIHTMIAERLNHCHAGRLTKRRSQPPLRFAFVSRLVIDYFPCASPPLTGGGSAFMLGGGRMPLACNRQQTKRSALRAPKPNVVMIEAMMFSPASPVSFVMRHRTIPRPVSANAYPPAFLSMPWTSPPNKALETIGVDVSFLFIKGFWLLDIAGRRCLSFFR